MTFPNARKKNKKPVIQLAKCKERIITKWRNIEKRVILAKEVFM